MEQRLVGVMDRRAVAGEHRGSPGTACELSAGLLFALQAAAATAVAAATLQQQLLLLCCCCCCGCDAAAVLYSCCCCLLKLLLLFCSRACVRFYGEEQAGAREMGCGWLCEGFPRMRKKATVRRCMDKGRSAGSWRPGKVAQTLLSLGVAGRVVVGVWGEHEVMGEREEAAFMGCSAGERHADLGR